MFIFDQMVPLAADRGLVLRISLDIITPRDYNALDRLRPSRSK